MKEVLLYIIQPLSLGVPLLQALGCSLQTYSDRILPHI